MLLLVLAATSSCARRESDPLRIAINPWPGFEYFYLAQELGYFRDAGVEVRLVEQTSLRDSRRAFVRGLVDGLLATPTDVAALELEGGRAAAVHQVFDESDGGDVIIARDPIRTVQDLRGRRIAIEPGLGNYFLHRALELANLKPHEVVVVDEPFTAATESLCNGSVDAIHSYPPTIEQLAKLTDGQFHIVFTSARLPHEILDLLIVDPRIARERESDLAKFERAYDRAVAFAQEHPDIAYQVMADREGVSADAFASVARNDLRMIAPEDRPKYLAPGGPVATAVGRSLAILRECQMTSRRYAGVPSVDPRQAPPTKAD